MSEKPMKEPGPDHPITIARNPAHVRVSIDGQVIADTDAALELREADYPPVQYVPLSDVDETLLQRSDHASYCPYKGDASYYDIVAEPRLENAVWEYRDPRPAVSEIAGHVAFYPDRVEIEVS